MPLTADDISALYRRHAEAMVTFFARRTYDPDAAIDLVGETFAVAIAERSRFRGRSDEEAAGWLYGIARNLLHGWYRRGDVERRALARLRVDTRGLTDVEYERVEELAGLEALRAEVATRMDGLTEDQREAVALRIVHERSYADIAATLGVSVETARARVSRGLRVLAKTVDAEAADG